MDPLAYQALMANLLGKGTPAAPAAAPALTQQIAAPAQSVATPTPPPSSAVATGTPARPTTPTPPAAVLELSALSTPAPRGFVARTLLRLHRDRRRSDAPTVPARSMYVTRITSNLVQLPADEADESAPPAAPVAAAASAPSPYKWGPQAPFTPPAATVPKTSAASSAAAVAPSTSAVGQKRRRDGDAADHADEDGDRKSDTEDEEDAAPATATAADEGEVDDDSASEADGGTTPRKASNPNGTKALRALAKHPLNRSGARSFNLYLRDINFRTHDLFELTAAEFLSIVPRWIVEAKQGGGAPYVYTTLKGYINSLQRIIKQFTPESEWSLISLKDTPEVREAVRIIKMRDVDQKAEAAPAIDTPLSTRRAQRIANGEVVIPRDYTFADSEPNSPRLSGLGPDDGDFGAAASSGRGRFVNPPHFTPAQEAHMLAQLDPEQPEGLLRMCFVHVAKHTNIMYAEEARSLSIRNFLRGSKIVKVRYEGGRKPRELIDQNGDPIDADSAAAAATHAEPAVPESESTASTTTAAAVPTASAPVSGELAEKANVSLAASAAAPADVAASASTAAAAAPAAADAMDTSGDGSAPAPSSLLAADASANADAAATSAKVELKQEPEQLQAAGSEFADENTPFTVVDQNHSPADWCWRSVRFVLYQPSGNSKRKPSFIYERPWEGPLSCPVRLFESFLAHRPPLLFASSSVSIHEAESSHALWLQCKKALAPFELEWYTSNPLGKHRLGSLISTLAQGLGYPLGYTNGSLVYSPTIPLPLTHEEIDSIRTENELAHFGVPTQEEQEALRIELMEQAGVSQQQLQEQQAQALQQALQQQQQAQQEEQNAQAQTGLPQLTAANGAFATGPSPFVPRVYKRHKPDRSFGEAGTASAAQMQQSSASHAAAPASSGQPQQPFMYPESSRAFTRGPPAPLNFYPPRSAVTSDYLQRNEAVLSHLDEVHKRAQKQREQQQSQFDTELAGLPPLLSPTAALKLTAPPLTLQAASAASVPSLLLSVDKFQRELSTLSAYALQCQRSLDSFRSQAAALKAEASAALKVQQQARKIAEQWQTIEEQRALIQQLQEEKRRAAGGDAQNAEPASVAAETAAAMDADTLPPLVAPVPPIAAAAPHSSPEAMAVEQQPEATQGDERKETATPMQMETEEESTAVVAPLEEQPAATGDVQMKQEENAALATDVLSQAAALVS